MHQLQHAECNCLLQEMVDMTNRELETNFGRMQLRFCFTTRSSTLREFLCSEWHWTRTKPDQPVAAAVKVGLSCSCLFLCMTFRSSPPKFTTNDYGQYVYNSIQFPYIKSLALVILTSGCLKMSPPTLALRLQSSCHTQRSKHIAMMSLSSPGLLTGGLHQIGRHRGLHSSAITCFCLTYSPLMLYVSLNMLVSI